MVISREEAAASLSAIDQTTGRRQTLNAYGGAGRIVMLWGAIWVIGYGAMAVLPGEQWGWVWLPLDVLGVVLTILMSRGWGKGGGARAMWKGAVAAIAITAVISGIFAIMRPERPEAVMALPALLAGFAYTLFGLTRLTRFTVLGAAIIAATLVGWFFFLPWFALWMAGVGGVGLGLGGYWMQRA